MTISFSQNAWESYNAARRGLRNNGSFTAPPYQTPPRTTRRSREEVLRHLAATRFAAYAVASHAPMMLSCARNTPISPIFPHTLLGGHIWAGGDEDGEAKLAIGV